MTPLVRAAVALISTVLASSVSACGPVATTDAERARTFSPTPGAPALRSVASDTQCRLLERPAKLPDVAQVIDTSALSVAFANEPNLAFGVVFDRAGGVDEVRRLEATTRTVEERREAIDRFIPAVRGQQPGEEWSVRVIRVDPTASWRLERSLFCPARLVELGPAASRATWYRAARRVGEVHVSVGVVGRVDAVLMPQAHDADAEAEVHRGYKAARFTVATLNGEAVPSVVLFGTRRAPARPRR